MISSVGLYENTKISEKTVQAQKQAPGTEFSSVLNKTVRSNQKTEKTGMDGIFQSAAKKYKVPENLLKAVAKAESGFDSKAVSRCGAQGVMQLMPQTAKSLGVTDSFDAEQNIMGGAKYLSQMLKKYDGDTKLALAAYNAGSGNVAKYGGIPPFKETQNYVVKVTKYMQEGANSPSAPIQSNTNTGNVSGKTDNDNGINTNTNNAVNSNTYITGDTNIVSTENPDDIYSYADYLKLIQELNMQMQLLYMERNMNLVHNISNTDTSGVSL